MYAQVKETYCVSSLTLLPYHYTLAQFSTIFVKFRYFTTLNIICILSTIPWCSGHRVGFLQKDFWFDSTCGEKTIFVFQSPNQEVAGSILPVGKYRYFPFLPVTFRSLT